MTKEIEIPEGYEARIEGNKVIIELKESEDERIRTRLIALVEAFGQGKYKDEMLAYLEKQKIPKGSPTPDFMTMLVPNRYNDQKPSEWSEEDEACANLILRELEQDKKDSPEYSRHFTGLIGWFTHRFKSLHPQSHWMPSEDQMAALRNVAYAPNTNNITLQSLYQQLRKSYSL